MATPSVLDTSTPATNTATTSTTTKLYEYIASYDFSSDLEFRKGLGTILGHPETPASDSELLREDNVVLQAKCFYISRFVPFSLPLSLSLEGEKKKMSNANLEKRMCHPPSTPPRFTTGS
jgi:hypothetical protein